MTMVVEPPAAPPPASARAPRPAWQRGVLPVAIVGGLLLQAGAADLTSRQVVAHLMASKMQDALDTPKRPSVHLGGGPFLPQLLRGRFGSVSLDARDATACKVRITHAHADLRGVRRSHGGAHASAIDGTGLLGYDAISAAIAPMMISGGDNGQVTISIGFSPTGLAANATVTPRIEGSTLVVDPGTATASANGQQFFNTSLAGLGPIRLQLRTIPDGMNVALRPKADGLEFSFTGRDVQLDDTQCGS